MKRSRCRACKITPENDERVGVHIGSGIGGFDIIEREHTALFEGGPRKISPFFIPAAIINLAAGHVSMRLGAKGPNEATATACTTSAHSIGDSFRIIQHNDADVMIAGGSEAAITPMGVGGFAAMRALSTRNDDPEKASRPWDKDRDGFVMGEGAGILVLEELEHAQRRGAPILAEIAGYGMSGDAYHMTQPAPEHEGGFRVMRNATRDAGISPDKVDYVNAHGTSTPIGDTLEAHAIRNFFGERKIPGELHQVHDRPSARGAGGLEAGITVLALRDQILPPTINLVTRTPKPAAWISSPTTPARPKSNTPCRILSASAGPTARCCSVDGQSRVYREFCLQLFWMRNYRQDNLFIPADQKIESPAAIHSGLPNVFRLVELLRPQGGVSELVQQKSELLGERLAHLREQRCVILVSALREADLHFRFLGFLFRLRALRSRAEMASLADS